LWAKLTAPLDDKSEQPMGARKIKIRIMCLKDPFIILSISFGVVNV
jgi:hypothetical protein